MADRRSASLSFQKLGACDDDDDDDDDDDGDDDGGVASAMRAGWAATGRQAVEKEVVRPSVSREGVTGARTHAPALPTKADMAGTQGTPMRGGNATRPAEGGHVARGKGNRWVRGRLAKVSVRGRVVTTQVENQQRKWWRVGRWSPEDGGGCSGDEALDHLPRAASPCGRPCRARTLRPSHAPCRWGRTGGQCGEVAAARARRARNEKNLVAWGSFPGSYSVSLLSSILCLV